MTGLFFNSSKTLIDEESAFDKIYRFIKNNQFIPIYSNGKKFFVFVAGGRIFWLDEMTLAFLIFTLTFFGTVGVRKFCKKHQLGKKVRKKFEKLLKTTRFRRGLGVRGGANFEDDVLHYEVEVNNNGRFLPLLPDKLNSKELLVKAIVKKCLHPNQYYRITNRALLEIIDKMMGFIKKDSVRIISYDVMILALWIANKPLSFLIYQGTSRAVSKLGSSAALIHSPFIAAIFVGITGGVGVNLALGGGNLFYSFLSSIPAWAAGFRIAESARNQLAIDCSDYVEKLPVRENTSRISGETLEPENSKISVSPSKPTRHETFISTAPGQSLYYEDRTEIETLDGVVTEGKKVNGEKIVYWKTSPKKPLVTESDYIPLKDRTKTLADVRDLDSTMDREAAERIRERIEKEQVQCRIIDEFLDELLE